MWSVVLTSIILSCIYNDNFVSDIGKKYKKKKKKKKKKKRFLYNLRACIDVQSRFSISLE